LQKNGQKGIVSKYGNSESIYRNSIKTFNFELIYSLLFGKSLTCKLVRRALGT